MSFAGRIVRIDPGAGIPGGEVAIECEEFDTSYLRSCRAWFGPASAGLVGVSARRGLAIVPDSSEGGEVSLTLESKGERSRSEPFVIGTKLAEDLHPVANPAFDPDDGALYVTRSGSRGQE